MNKLDKISLWYIGLAIPFIICLVIWGGVSDATALSLDQTVYGYIWDFLGWIFMIWIVISFYLLTKMVIRPDFREIILKRISGIKERDEREKIISGEAAKFSFLSTLAILFFTLFLSLIQIQIGKYPSEMKKEGKNGYITIGVNIDPMAIQKTTVKEENQLEIFKYSGFPLSTSLLILIIILWQFGSYKYILRREI